MEVFECFTGGGNVISLPASFTSQFFGGAAGGNTPVMVVVAPQVAPNNSKRVIGGVPVS